MEKTIWKYPLKMGRTVLTVPEVFEPVRIAMQDGKPCLWAVVLPEETTKEFVVGMSGTGHGVPLSAGYLGSVSDGPFEWHFWAEKKGGA
jgi:hypothetical protein